ncbi:MAG: hypothetical protein ACI9TH_005291 [Kiritimatiellia bacterium]|jgi:hypothetical protein
MPVLNVDALDREDLIQFELAPTAFQIRGVGKHARISIKRMRGRIGICSVPIAGLVGCPVRLEIDLGNGRLRNDEQRNRQRLGAVRRVSFFQSTCQTI